MCNQKKWIKMKPNELKSILQMLGFSQEAEPTMMYVFYQLPDGRVCNFSLSVRAGAKMLDGEVVEMMRREYPATSEATVMAVERPEGVVMTETEWIDTVDICHWLKVSRRTVERWRQQGLIKGRRMGGRVYYSRQEVNRALWEGKVKENVNY